MTNKTFNPWLYRLAVSELCVALITLTFGALTTTKNAGMAFPDWPTSDGYLMVTYPWLKDYAVNWNKFLEHGHRLAGMLIGIWSIALVVATFLNEPRRWVKWLSVMILLGVIGQGLLGGFRVQLNDRGLAMLHGIFAAIVFSLMGTMAAVTSSRWESAPEYPSTQSLGMLKALACVSVVLLGLQYVLGSLIRHQGTGLHEHLGLGILVLLVIMGQTGVALRVDNSWLNWSALMLLCVVFAQVLFGLMTWVFKFGLSNVGYVAVADSVPQVLIRTTHMVWGVITLTSAVVHAVKVFRVSAVSPRAGTETLELHHSSSLLSNGGAR